MVDGEELIRLICKKLAAEDIRLYDSEIVNAISGLNEVDLKKKNF